VFDNFGSAIAERAEADQTLETTVVGINTAEVIEAHMQGRSAFVTVKFVSEQINVTRSAAGEVVDGDPSRVRAITDIWTFARNTRSRDPNWTLVETRSQN
jgi:predicted lipid-binding transport protein (Tim44 family)